jgi:hypothetical protein
VYQVRAQAQGGVCALTGVPGRAANLGRYQVVRKLREHHIALTLIAFGIAAAAVVAIAAAFGFDAFADAWTHPHFGWLALALAGWALAVPAYALAYRTLAQLEGGSKLPLPLVLRVVIAGFGPFRPGGGFVLDHHALNAVEGDEDAATIRVLGLGALEWALLAPAACVCAIVLLAIGDHRPMSSLLWPWALAVPAGFAIGLWLAVPARRERIGKRWSSLGRTLHGVGILRDLGPSCWLSWSGIALYWALDIASFYGAVRFIGVHPNLGETILDAVRRRRGDGGADDLRPSLGRGAGRNGACLCGRVSLLQLCLADRSGVPRARSRTSAGSRCRGRPHGGCGGSA